MNEGSCNGRWKGGLDRYVTRAAQLLQDVPMTRQELEAALGTRQQRVSEVLRLIDAHVVGSRPCKRGRSAPLYALGEQEPHRLSIGRVTSVWDLGMHS